MMRRKILTAVLAGAMLTAGAARGDGAIVVVAEQGKTVAQFKVGDSRCVLKDDRLVCVLLDR